MLVKFLAKRLSSKSSQKNCGQDVHTLDDEFLKLFIVVSRSRELIERFERDVFTGLEFPELQFARALEIAETIVGRLEQKLSEIIDVVGRQQTSNMLHAAPILQAKVALPRSVKKWLQSIDLIDSSDELHLSLNECSVVLEDIFALLSESVSDSSKAENLPIDAFGKNGSSTHGANGQRDDLLPEKANDSRRHPFLN